MKAATVPRPPPTPPPLPDASWDAEGEPHDERTVIRSADELEALITAARTAPPAGASGSGFEHEEHTVVGSSQELVDATLQRRDDLFAAVPPSANVVRRNTPVPGALRPATESRRAEALDPEAPAPALLAHASDPALPAYSAQAMGSVLEPAPLTAPFPAPFAAPFPEPFPASDAVDAQALRGGGKVRILAVLAGVLALALAGAVVGVVQLSAAKQRAAEKALAADHEATQARSAEAQAVRALAAATAEQARRTQAEAERRATEAAALLEIPTARVSRNELVKANRALKVALERALRDLAAAQATPPPADAAAPR